VRRVAAMVAVALVCVGATGDPIWVGEGEDRQVDLRRVSELMEKERQLDALLAAEDGGGAGAPICLFAVLRPYSAALLFSHEVSYAVQEGESATDAAVRTCSALSASLKPEGSQVTTYCGACEFERLEVGVAP